ncbi:MAG: L,D-transpeptidase [Clostridia bacterium]|nr:L,D-transpeptidase [Clostridia bacterium]
MLKRCVLKIATVAFMVAFLLPLYAEAAVVYKEGSEITFHNASPWYIKDDVWINGKHYAERTGDVLYISLEDFGGAFRCYTFFNPDENSVFVSFADKTIWQGVGVTDLYIDNVAYENPAPYISEESGEVMIPLEPYASVIGYKGEFEVKEDYPPGQMTLKREKTPYTLTSLEVNKAAQLVTVYGKDPSGNIEPVRYMLCSTGVNNSTPSGTFRVSPLGGEWYFFSKFKCYVLYASQIVGDVCFHSIPHNGYSFASMSAAGYSVLGSPASHGCIRLLAEDSKFIHQNCRGLSVVITNGYTNETTNSIRAQLLASKPSYSEYISKMQSGNY